MSSEPMLDHERLDVYQLARELARVGNELMRVVPKGAAELVQQFRSASLSVPLNIAEGGGEFAPREKARFYRIAKRSATECAAVLDHMVDLGLVPERSIAEARTLIRRIAGALVKLILSTDRLAGTTTAPAPARKRVPVP